MKLYSGTYAGVVRENRDPMKLGRLKVFVPLVYGVGGETTEEIGLENIPWALPAGMPSGGSVKSGGIDWLPEVEDRVWVRFLDGEPEKPIWEWGMQTIDQGKALKLHDYDSVTGKPKRGGLTRYGHTLDMTDGVVVVTTKNGYSITLTDSDTKSGQVEVRGPSGHKVKINDQEKTISLESAAGQLIQVDDLGNSITIMANETLEVQTGEETSIEAANISLNALGEGIKVAAATEVKISAGSMTLTITPSGFNFSSGG